MTTIIGIALSAAGVWILACLLVLIVRFRTWRYLLLALGFASQTTAVGSIAVARIANTPRLDVPLLILCGVLCTALFHIGTQGFRGTPQVQGYRDIVLLRFLR